MSKFTSHEKKSGWIYKSWNRHSTKLLIATAVLAVICGTLGIVFRDGPPQSMPSAFLLLDALLVSFASLTMEGFSFLDGGQTKADWFLRANQLFVVAFIAIASGKLLESFFQVRNGWRRRRIERKPHDICIGLGWKGQQFIELDTEIPTIVIDLVTNDAKRERCDFAKAALMICDATVLNNLMSLSLRNTRRIFVTCGVDTINLDITAKLIQVIKEKQLKPAPMIVVSLDQPESASLLNALNGLTEAKIDLRHFHAKELTAHLLLDTMIGDEKARRVIDRHKEPAPKATQVFLTGDGEMLEALLVKFLQVSLFEPEMAVVIHLWVPDPAEFSRRFVNRYPCYTAAVVERRPVLRAKDKRWTLSKVLPDIQLTTLPANAAEQIALCGGQLKPDVASATVIVAFDSAAQSASIAQNIAPVLHRLGHDQDLALWVYANLKEVRLREGLAALLANPPSPSDNGGNSSCKLSVYVFNDFLGQLGRDIAALERIDFFAKKINALYHGITDEIGHGDSLSALGAWLKCTEEEKNSNRLAALYMQVLERVAQRRGHEIGSAEIKDDLAQLEHRRWCAEYLLNGYEPLLTQETPEAIRKTRKEAWYSGQAKRRYKAEKQHLALIPWDEMESLLGDETARKEKDKDHRPLEFYSRWKEDFKKTNSRH